MFCRAAFLLVFCVAAAPLIAVQQPATAPPTDDDISIQMFLQTVETAISTTNRATWLDLLSPNADRDAATEFYDSMVPRGVTRVVVRERDRTDLVGALPGEGYRLIAEVFIETGARGRILTWRLDIRRPRDTTERQPWRVISEERLSSIEGLHRLSLHPEKQYAARDMVIQSIDFELRLASGAVYVAETSEGVTALVLIGDGTMVFAPGPVEERGQVRIFSGSDAIETSFSAAFVRLNPFEFEQQLKRQALTPAPIEPRTFRRAQAIFDEEVGKSFSLDLSELSRDTWSLLPQAGDFLAEVRTRRFDNLTYARSAGEAEDVTLFHRVRKKNVAAYASPMKLSSRGRFFNEDDLVEYDVLHYDINATFSPERQWIDGRARMRIRIKAFALAALTLKLAEQFSVRSVTSDELGRLLFLKVRNQNSVVVNLPSPVARDMELTLEVAYQGVLRSQGLDQESLDVQDTGRVQPEEMPFVPAEPHWLFSNRSYWYPQGQVTDYSTANVRITVPAAYAAVAGGMVSPSGSVTTQGPNGVPRTTFAFAADQPARYIGLVISKLTLVDSAHVALDIVTTPSAPEPEATTYVGAGILRAKPAPKKIPAVGTRNTVLLSVLANRRQEQRARETMGTAAEILRLYARTVGDVPYDGMTIAMVESNLPGGHSPAYVAMINNPLPLHSPYSWRNDPAAFNNFPEFYLAHELAHQWWGQAVGWQNYHEQWLSEGISQYFAALFARERRGEPAFRDVLRQFRRWAVSQSDQGAVYLGYRLGHLKNDSRVFRAVVYNKGASVLHMLRLLMGDDAFFRGMRRYYADNRFRKAGTADLRKAMEAEAGRSLERFFQRWIFESGIPRVRYSTAIEGQEIVVRLEQTSTTSDVATYELPVTVSMHFADKTVEHVVPLVQASVETRFPLTGTLKSIEVNADNASLAIFEKR